MKRLLGLLFLVSPWATTGCNDLSLIPQNDCGNGVTEVEVGEACDGEPDCEPPGAVHACRYVCESDADCPQVSACDEATPDCSAVWRCGRDALCRRGSGTFSAAGETYHGPVLRMTSHDVDHDGHDELLRHGPGELSLLRAESGHGTVSIISAIPLAEYGAAMLTTEALVADLNADGIDDLSLGTSAAPFGGSMSVFRVQADLATLSPTLYPNFQLPSGPGEAQVFVARIFPSHATEPFPGFRDHQLLHLANAPSGPGMMSSSSPRLVVYGDLNEVKDVRTAGVVLAEPSQVNLAAWGLADLDTSTPCEELVLGHPGANQLQVYALCRLEAGKPVLNEWNDANYLSYAPITVAGGASLPDTLSELQLIDIDGDGNRDVAFVVSANGGGGAVHVAYGAGDGTFSSDHDLSTPVDQISVAFSVGSGESLSATSVLVAGDFDSDGREELRVACADCQAVVADFDQSGTPDIAVAKSDPPGISLSRSMGNGSFTVEVLQTPEVHLLTAGDIDGDGLSDLLYTVSTGQGDEQALAVSFGRVAASPTSSVLFGALPPIVAMRAGRLVREDAAHDTLFVARSMNGSLQSGLMVGSASRLGGAPFVFDAIYPTFFSGQPSGMDPKLSITPRQLGAGRFGGARATVALTEDFDSSDSTNAQTGTTRLWLLALRDDAIIDAQLAMSSLGESSDVPCRDCPLVVLDIDGDDNDEVLLFDQNQIHVFEHQDSGLTLKETIDSDHAFARAAQNTVKLADLDGDGHLDVLLLDEKGAIVLLYGSEAGGFESTVRLAGDEAFTGFAPLHADADAALEVAAVGARSLVLIQLNERSQAGTRVLSTAEVPMMTGGLHHLCSGDFNGDGVDDLVDVRGHEGFSIMYGEPVLP